MKKELKIAVGADGVGTTFEHIARSKNINAKIVLLFTNNKESLAVEKANHLSIPVLILDRDRIKEARDKILCEALRAAMPDLICLAGYLKLIPPCLISSFPKRIINSHPAFDLKRFGGKGMYGTNVVRAVIETELKETGSTIHFVSKIYDDPAGVIKQTGPIPVLPDDTPESLLARQLPRERELYIKVINMFREGKLP